MLLRESVQHCAVCDEVTPHSRRVVAGPVLLAAAALVGAARCFLPDIPRPLLGGALVGVSLLVLAWDRERFKRIRCERCRGRKLRELRRTKPTLDGNTEIGPF